MRGAVRVLAAMTLSLSTLGAIGCRLNPNVEIAGSYFPGWMIAISIGVALTLAAHSLLRRMGLLRSIGHPAIIYPGLVILFTCLLWLCFFD